MTGSVDFTDPALRTELGEAVRETMDGVDASTIGGAPIPDVAGHDGRVVESLLGITGGAVDAALVVRVSLATAVALTAAMLDEPPSEITADEACGAIGELSNVIAGSVKMLIDDETELAIPEAAIHDVAEAAPRDMVVVDHRLGRFEVVLVETS